jgi:Polyketide cyclase / dehydrase and lipid transport
MAVHDVRVIHLSIDAAPEQVARYVADPRTMPVWAPNFGHAITPAENGEWVMETATGPFRVRFAAPNDAGVLDHWVRAPDGTEFHNPIRVVPNGSGSELSFTLFRQPGWSHADFDRDEGLVRADLERLRALLESAAPDPYTQP